MTDTFVPKVGSKVRVLNTEFAQLAGLPIGELLEVVDLPKALETSTVVRVQNGEERTLLINDSIDTEFEVVSN